MSISGEIGGLLGSMVGLAQSRLFLLYTPIAIAVSWRKYRLWALVTAGIFAAINIVSVWSRWRDLGLTVSNAANDAAFLAIVWFLWAVAIYAIIAALRRLFTLLK